MRYLNTGKNKIIGLISSVPSEGGLLVRKLKLIRKGINNCPVIYSGNIAGKNIVYSVSGIGKTNASHAVTLLIQNYSPALIINFGVGGAYPSTGLAVGDIAVATKEIYADEGVWLKDGLKPLETIKIPLLKIKGRRYFNEFPLNRKLAQAALNSAKLFTSSRSGIFTTVSSCTGTNKRSVELKKRFNAVCENMEGASIAHLCCLYKIPCIEIRGISNIVEERDTRKWDIRLAAENCQKALINFIEAVNI